MGLGKKRLGEILVDYQLLKPEQLSEVLSTQSGTPLGRLVIEQGLCTEENLLRALGIQFGLPTVQLHGIDIPGHVLAKVPYALAEEFQVLPLALIRDAGKDTLLLAMCQLDHEALVAIRYVSQMRVLPMLASDVDLHAAVQRMYWSEATDLELSLPSSLTPEIVTDDPFIDTSQLDALGVSIAALAISPEELLEELGL